MSKWYECRTLYKCQGRWKCRTLANYQRWNLWEDKEEVQTTIIAKTYVQRGAYVRRGARTYAFSVFSVFSAARYCARNPIPYLVSLKRVLRTVSYHTYANLLNGYTNKSTCTQAFTKSVREVLVLAGTKPTGARGPSQTYCTWSPSFHEICERLHDFYDHLGSRNFELNARSSQLAASRVKSYKKRSRELHQLSHNNIRLPTNENKTSYH